MRSWHPVHDFCTSHRDAEWHTRSDSLRHADHVGLDTRVLDREPLPGAPDAALDFVHHQHDAMTVADAPQLLHEDLRSHDITALTLHWLDENGRDLLWGQRRLEQFFFDETRATQGEVVRFLRPADAAAVYIGIPHVRHSRNERRKSPLLLRL